MKKDPQFLLQTVLTQQETIEQLRRELGQDTESKERKHTPVQDRDESIRKSQQRKQMLKEQRIFKSAERRSLHRTLDQLMFNHDLRFVHIRPVNPFARPKPPENIIEAINNRLNRREEYFPNAGITIAYSRDKFSNVIWFSIANCSVKDNYDKLTGAINAARSFERGAVTSLYNFSKLDDGAYLYKLFSEAFGAD